jgi:hypothetical protein
MELKELLRALADGKKIRHKKWGYGEYIYLDGKTFKNERGEINVIIPSMGCAMNGEFELYTEPELTPQDIIGKEWEGDGCSTMFHKTFVNGEVRYTPSNKEDFSRFYTAKEIQEQFTRWEG